MMSPLVSFSMKWGFLAFAFPLCSLKGWSSNGDGQRGSWGKLCQPPTPEALWVRRLGLTCTGRRCCDSIPTASPSIHYLKKKTMNTIVFSWISCWGSKSFIQRANGPGQQELSGLNTCCVGQRSRLNFWHHLVPQDHWG